MSCDDANTFPDQTVFLTYLAERGIDTGMLLVPGAALELDDGNCRVHWPTERAEALRPFTDKAAYLRCYADRMRPRIEAGKLRWPARTWTSSPSSSDGLSRCSNWPAISGPG